MGSDSSLQQGFDVGRSSFHKPRHRFASFKSWNWRPVALLLFHWIWRKRSRRGSDAFGGIRSPRCLAPVAWHFLDTIGGAQG
eukprot:7287229-Pyramimonas_sp.AAC.1